MDFPGERHDVSALLQQKLVLCVLIKHVSVRVENNYLIVDSDKHSIFVH